MIFNFRILLLCSIGPMKISKHLKVSHMGLKWHKVSSFIFKMTRNGGKKTCETSHRTAHLTFSFHYHSQLSSFTDTRVYHFIDWSINSLHRNILTIMSSNAVYGHRSSPAHCSGKSHNSKNTKLFISQSL